MSVDPLAVKPSVLIVDDHPANLLALEVLLEKQFSTQLADSGRKALDLTERSDFAAVLLDVRMPGMDGFETAVELRRRERTRYTPIIFTSAFDKAPEEILRGMIPGITDYLPTPLDPEFAKFKVATYASLYLRNRVLQDQVDRLSQHMRSLRAEIAKSTPLDEAVDKEIRHLETLSEDLKRRTRELESPPLAPG